MFWLKFEPSSDRNIEKTQLYAKSIVVTAGKSLVAHVRLVGRAERTSGNSPRIKR